MLPNFCPSCTQKFEYPFVIKEDVTKIFCPLCGSYVRFIDPAEEEAIMVKSILLEIGENVSSD